MSTKLRDSLRIPQFSNFFESPALDNCETSANICSNLEQMNNHRSDILNHEKILSVIKGLEQNPAIIQRDLALKFKVSLEIVSDARKKHHMVEITTMGAI